MILLTVSKKLQQKWQLSIKEELAFINENQVWDLVRKPAGECVDIFFPWDSTAVETPKEIIHPVAIASNIFAYFAVLVHSLHSNSMHKFSLSHTSTSTANYLLILFNYTQRDNIVEFSDLVFSAYESFVLKMLQVF